MKIVALIKQILDPQGVVVRRDKERIFVNKEAYIIAPGDKNGLEAALRIKDAWPDTEVVAVSLGPLRADDALREALAMGVDIAYLLHDDAFAEVDLPGVARILATAVSLINPDLIITGRESGSDAAGQIGPRLAEIMDVAQMTDVHSLTVSDGAVQAVRRWEDGYATVTAALPAVITIAPGVNQPRYPHGARIMNAYRDWEVSIWDAADLGLTAAVLCPLTEFRSESFAAPLVVGERLRGEPEQIARVLKSEVRAVIGWQCSQ
jgi:electron transfer flavoprotein beta subunit